MALGPQDVDFAHWTVEEKMVLIERLWESIPDSEEAVPDWHLAILKERIAEADANPGSGSTWEEVRARLLADQ